MKTIKATTLFAGLLMLVGCASNQKHPYVKTWEQPYTVSSSLGYTYGTKLEGNRKLFYSISSQAPLQVTAEQDGSRIFRITGTKFEGYFYTSKPSEVSLGLLSIEPTKGNISLQELDR